MQPLQDAPQSRPPEDQGQKDIFVPTTYLTQRQRASHNDSPNISTVARGLQNLTLHPHAERNLWVTGCLVCAES